VKAYYNENDPKAAAWLRELIKRDLIAPGDVDERSIADVRPEDLDGYCQCHFFAGIGGWSCALRLAGWPDDRPVWTGSCPCQPFSAAGQRKGFSDKRHLWPEFHRLIRDCSPAIVLGEQVASKDGRLWLDGVRADLEGLGYAVGAADLCAAGAGAPHIRQRLWWVADADGGQSGVGLLQRSREHGQQQADGVALRVADAQRAQSGMREQGVERQAGVGRAGPTDDGSAGSRLAHTERDGRRGDEHERGSQGRVADGRAGAWSDFDILECRDGKARRVEAGTFPLAHGIPARMGRLRGYGNAIVPQVAAEFIQAYCEAVADVAQERGAA
jgi:DNA (cytosine-5)-methyltransferase 1